MKYYLVLPLVTLLFFGCSKSDSNPDIEEKNKTIPTLTTLSVTEITETSAQSGGNITDDGGVAVTSRGICWSTSTNPTISDNRISGDSGLGVFNSLLTNLNSNSTYFLRAYATNSVGTAYGNEVSFKTLEPEPIQKIFDGTIELSNQDEVESFGAEGYTEITGSLIIYGTVTDLSALNSLEFVGDDLIVSNADNLTSVNGLENLVSIGNTSQFIGNDALTDISALADLSVITAVFFVGNNALQTISGFSETTSLTSLLQIDNNANLEVISGFQNLERLGANLQITNNPVLIDISGFSNLKELSVEFGELWLNNNDSLMDITPLSSLEVAKDVIIDGNAILQEITIFNHFTSLNSVEITNNPELASIEGFEALTNVVWDLQIRRNVLLTTITAFDNLGSVGREVEISYNIVLEDFCIFNNLITNGFTGSFDVTVNAYNPTLQDMIDGNCKP